MTERRHAWAEIDTSAITRNVRRLKALAAPRTMFMAVVKADGYGHGAVQSARAALAGGAERLGVATLDEALELREAGIERPIQVFSEPPLSSVRLVIDGDITSTVTTREYAAALSAEALRREAHGRCHLKIDTGMNRIGVRAEDAPAFGSWLRSLPGLEVEGVFTHFATADVPGDWEFTSQIDRFASAVEQLRTEGARPPLVHAANSPATILHPETHLDMVRCGIAIYGLHPAKTTYGVIDLEPAMSVKARVSLVKRIGLGEGVSYGFTWHASGPTTIATIPLGYADGVHRVLSDNMAVLIGGKRCRQVGRVCMDQLMVEIPAGVDVGFGAEAVIVGAQGDEHIVMDELAEAAGTINYEMACGFSRRLSRIWH
jgi:alanine racemase